MEDTTNEDLEVTQAEATNLMDLIPEKCAKNSSANCMNTLDMARMSGISGGLSEEVMTCEQREHHRQEALVLHQQANELLQRIKRLEQEMHRTEEQAKQAMSLATPALPPELWFQILIYAGPPSAEFFALRLVCKMWSDIIHSNAFAYKMWAEWFGGTPYITTSLKDPLSVPLTITSSDPELNTGNAKINENSSRGENLAGLQPRGTDNYEDEEDDAHHDHSIANPQFSEAIRFSSDTEEAAKPVVSETARCWYNDLVSTTRDKISKDKKGRTRVFWWAGKRGYHKLVERMVIDAPILANRRIKMRHGSTGEIYECTVLYLAAMHDQQAVLKVLLAHGANCNEKGRYNQTPLHIACQRGNDGVVNLLLENGAGLEDKDSNGNTPMLLAAAFGKDSILQRLIDAGADLLARNERGQTALHATGYMKNVNVLKILLGKYPSLNICDNIGRTPIFQCSRCNFIEGVKMLLEAGADPSIRDLVGVTPAQEAYSSGYNDIGDLLTDFEKYGRKILGAPTPLIG